MQGCDPPLRRAAFLDRDGVINVERNYVHKIEEFEYVPGAVEGLRTLARHGYRLFVVTNQSGIARGFYTEEQYEALNRHMLADLASKGITVAATYFCPHHPTAGLGRYRVECQCRKPKPGMLLRAAEEHRVDLPASVLIGDKRSDIEAGQAAGVGTSILVDSGHRSAAADREMADACFPDLLAAALWIERQALA